MSSLLPDRGPATERLLLREFSRRINDELASAINLVAVAAGRCDSSEAKIALDTVRDHLERHAHLHHSLQLPEYSTTIDLAAYLKQLCRAIGRSRLPGEGVELLLSVNPFRMSSERCWLLGTIVFELIAEATRHSFQDRAGSIRIEIWPAGGSIECSVTDNGATGECRLPAGHRSIVEALAAGLQGTVERQSGPGATRTIVTIPMTA